MSFSVRRNGRTPLSVNIVRLMYYVVVFCITMVKTVVRLTVVMDKKLFNAIPEKRSANAREVLQKYYVDRSLSDGSNTLSDDLKKMYEDRIAGLERDKEYLMVMSVPWYKRIFMKRLPPKSGVS